MRRILRSKLIHHNEATGSVIADECEVFSVGGQLEVRVKFVASHSPGFPRSKNNEVGIGGHDDRGEVPLVWRAKIIGEIKIGKVSGIWTRIVELDPILGIPIFIKKAIRCRVCGKLVDAWSRWIDIHKESGASLSLAIGICGR